MAEKEGRLPELVGDHGPSPEAPPKSKRSGSKGDIRRGATARGVMEKSWGVTIERKEVRRDESNKYFFQRGLDVSFESQRGRWRLKPPRMTRFLEGRMGREKVSVLLSIEEEYREHKH